MSSFKVGKVFGLEIFVDYSWILIFTLISWLLAFSYYPAVIPEVPQLVQMALGLITAILFFLSILVHELSHSVIARKNGMPVKRISLFLLGGVSEILEEPPSAQSELKMALAGPITSLALAGLFWILTITLVNNLILSVFFAALFSINFLLFIFNILPGFPLDGGRVLRALLWHYGKNLKKATRVASFIGKLIAILIVGFALFQIIFSSMWSGIWLLLIGMFLFRSANQGYQEILIREALGNALVSALSQKSVVVPSQTPINSLLANYFLPNNVTSLPVGRDEEIVGVVSLKDVRKQANNLDNSSTVNEVMKDFPRVRVKPNDNAILALKIMISNNLAVLPVSNNGQILGIITLEGIAEYLAKEKII